MSDLLILGIVAGVLVLILSALPEADEDGF